MKWIPQSPEEENLVQLNVLILLRAFHVFTKHVANFELFFYYLQCLNFISA